MTLSGLSALGDWLGPTLDRLPQQPDLRRLVRALALGDGFGLHLVITDSPRAAAALQLWLAEAVALERGAPIVSRRLGPYPLDPRIPGPGPVDEALLDAAVLAPLYDRALETFVCIDAVRASERDFPAWRSRFLRLNEQRNAIARDLTGALVLLLPTHLETELTRTAPDLWSIRSLSITVPELDAVLGPSSAPPTTPTSRH